VSDGAHETDRTAEDAPLPGGDFRLFVQRLGYQGLMNLGRLEHPITKAEHVDLPHARALIDDLAMLEEKTRGNLDADEAAYLQKLLSDLRHLYSELESQQG